MDLKRLHELYRDALSIHLTRMGIREDVADFEARRIFHRWIRKD